jgi:hypothetical protein
VSYCTPQDVRDLAPQLVIDNTSKPNTGQVTGMIEDVERELDAQLANLGYVTPVSAPISAAILKDKVAHAVVARVLRGKHFGNADPGQVGAEQAQKVYDQWLKALASATDPTDLPDAARTGGDAEKASVNWNSGGNTTVVADPPVSIGMTF